MCARERHCPRLVGKPSAPQWKPKSAPQALLASTNPRSARPSFCRHSLTSSLWQRNSAGDELCRLLISLTLSHDPAPAPHPHANLAEADDAEPAERPPMCPLPVEEALGCSLGSLEAALELAMALVVAREASKGARCLASRMSIASMDLLISLSTCLPDASPLPDASWLPDAEPPMPLPDILSRGTVPVRLSKIPPRDPLPPPSCLSALVSTGRIVLRSPGGDRRANIELPTSIATPPPR